MTVFAILLETIFSLFFFGWLEGTVVDSFDFIFSSSFWAGHRNKRFSLGDSPPCWHFCKRKEKKKEGSEPFQQQNSPFPSFLLIPSFLPFFKKGELFLRVRDDGGLSRAPSNRAHLSMLSNILVT